MGLYRKGVVFPFYVDTSVTFCNILSGLSVKDDIFAWIDTYESLSVHPWAMIFISLFK